MCYNRYGIIFLNGNGNLYITFLLICKKDEDASSHLEFLYLSIALLSIGWSLKEVEELFDKKINYKKLSSEEFDEMLEFILRNLFSKGSLLFSSILNFIFSLLNVRLPSAIGVFGL